MEEIDDQNRKGDENVLDTVGRSLKGTKNLIEKIAEAEGFDLTVTKEDEIEYEKMQKATNPENNPLVKESLVIYQDLEQFLNKLQFENPNRFKEEFENLYWHHSLIYPKVARAVYGLLELEYEKDKEMEEIHISDSKNSAWVAYRSLTICINSLETIWNHTTDSEIRNLLKKSRELLKNIETKLL